MAWALSLVAFGIAALVVLMLVSALQGAYRDYGTRGTNLVNLALQDLVWFSPLLVVSGLILWFASRLARSAG